MASNRDPLLDPGTAPDPGTALDPGTAPDPGTALDRIRSWQEEIDNLVTRTRTMSDRLRALRVTASDPRSLVEVTINSSGALLDVRFGPHLRQHDPDYVAGTVMATIQAARRQAVTLTSTIIEETVGADSIAAREMLSRATDSLTTSPRARP